MRVIDVKEQVSVIGLTDFISTVIGTKFDKVSCKINSCDPLYIKNWKA